jgi:hypothetical protein
LQRLSSQVSPIGLVESLNNNNLSAEPLSGFKPLFSCCVPILFFDDLMVLDDLLGMPVSGVSRFFSG